MLLSAQQPALSRIPEAWKAGSRFHVLTRVLLRSAFSSEISSSLSRSCSRHALSSRVSVANSCRNQGMEVIRESGMETSGRISRQSISHPNPTSERW